MHISSVQPHSFLLVFYFYHCSNYYCADCECSNCGFVSVKQCLRPPYGVAYMAMKKNYVGFNSGSRHLRSLVDEGGIFGAHLVKEMTDRDVWKFFLK